MRDALESPVDLWAACAVAEEMPLPSADLFEALRDPDALGRHLVDIAKILDELPPDVAAPYAGWVTRADNYRFASEGFYQFRILKWLANASRAGRIDTQTPVFLARQLIRPSAFADTPRIKHVGGTAFVLYPQAAIYWLYEFMTLIAHDIDGTPMRDETIVEFLHRSLARMSYAMAASPDTAYGIDFLLDEIVLGGSAMAEAHPVSSRAAALTSGVEDFIINHELAHALHGHAGSTAAEVEAEADRTAIGLMLFSMTGEWGSERQRTVDVSTWPIEAYVALQVWGLIRSSADRRIRVYTSFDDDDLARARARNDQALRIRMARLEMLDDLFQFPAPKATRALLEACDRMVHRITTVDLDDGEVGRIVRLSRSLARRDYLVLREEIRGAANSLTHALEAK